MIYIEWSQIFIVTAAVFIVTVMFVEIVLRILVFIVVV